MTKLIAATNHKGGVAKTTSTISLAAVLAEMGKRVLLVDLDPQGQASIALGRDPEGCVFHLLIDPKIPRQWIRMSGRENLDLIPGNHTTATAQIVINVENRPIDSIKTALKPLAKDYDYIILDTAPSVGGIQERAIWASDLVIVPTATEFLSSDGVRNVIEMMRALAARGWEGKLLGILPTFFDETTRESKATMENLYQAFGERLLSPIHRATILRECAAEGITIFEKDSNSRSAEEYRSLAEYIVRL